MAISTVLCHVSHATVTVIRDFEGGVERVICPDYDTACGTCRLKERATSGGPLSQLVERLSEETLDSQGQRCDLMTA